MEKFPQDCVENHRQLVNSGNRRHGLPLGSTHQLVIQYHMAILENIRTSNMIWTENLYTFRIMYFFFRFLFLSFSVTFFCFVCYCCCLFACSFVLEAELCIVLAVMELSL